MTLEQLFQRYCDRVHPFFWPVLWLSLHLYQRRKAELYTRGCQGLFIEIQWWGTVTITGGLFPDADPGWKAHLYAANGAYAALPAGPRRSFGARPLQAGEEAALHGYPDACVTALSGLTGAPSVHLPPRAGGVPARPGTGAFHRSRDGPPPAPEAAPRTAMSSRFRPMAPLSARSIARAAPAMTAPLTLNTYPADASQCSRRPHRLGRLQRR